MTICVQQSGVYVVGSPRHRHFYGFTDYAVAVADGYRLSMTMASLNSLNYK